MLSFLLKTIFFRRNAIFHTISISSRAPITETVGAMTEFVAVEDTAEESIVAEIAIVVVVVVVVGNFKSRVWWCGS